MATEHEKFTMAQEIAKLSHQVQTLRSRVTSGAPSKAPTPSCGPSPTLTADLLQHRKDIKKELDDLPFSLAISQGTLDPRESFSSASSSASSRSSSPCRTSVDRAATFPDLTQHPAAVLCDLPCQSGTVWRQSTTLSSALDETQRQQFSQLQTHLLWQLSTLRLCLTLHLTVSSTLLLPLSQLFTSLKTGLALKQTTMTPMLFHLIHWLISTPANPLRLTPASSSSIIKTTSTCSLPLHKPRSIFRTSLLRRLLACSPALARPLKDATAWALQIKTRYALSGISNNVTVEQRKVDGIDPIEHGVVAGLIQCNAQSIEGGWRSLMMLAVELDVIENSRVPGRRRRKTSREIRKLCITLSGLLKHDQGNKAPVSGRRMSESASLASG